MRFDEALNILRPEPPNMDGLKKAYRSKSFEYHPDKNPHGLEMMKLVNLAHEILKDNPLSWVSKESHDYSRFTEPPLDEEMQRIIDKVKRWPDLEIEVIGTWIWVKVKRQELRYSVKLSFLGFGYSRKRQAWYWHPADFKFRNENDKRVEMSMDEMRNVWGSRKVKNEPFSQL